jgi:hypothetical protein
MDNINTTMQAESSLGWPYPDPKPGDPPRKYPPPTPFSPSKVYKKYDCSCCGKKEIDTGLIELKRRFLVAQGYLNGAGLPKRLGGNGPVTCGTANERVLTFMEPTPRCWTCFMDVRWDEDPLNPPKRWQPFWNENFIHCFTINNQGIQKEIIFDYFEHAYYHIGTGIYENLAEYYAHHPYPGKSDVGGWPRTVDCNEPEKEWKPDYRTFDGILGRTGRDILR